MTYPWRAGAAALSLVAASCTGSGGSASADSSAGAPHVAAVAERALDTVSSARSAIDTAPPVGTRGAEPREGGSIPPAGHASSARGGARVTGGPQRTPVPPRSSGCGGTFVSVTVRASALATSDAASLRSLSTQLLAPVRAQVGALSLSPAIHAFRVAVTDPASAQQVADRLRAAPQVESAELDDCAVRTH